MLPNAPSLKSLYTKLSTDRDPYLRRARACSAITIPSLYPPEGSTGATELPTPWSSFGARAVNSLGTKLAVAVLPPNRPMYKEDLEYAARRELGAAVGEVERALSIVEQIVTKDIEASAVRPAIHEAMKLLVVGGNVLMYESPSGSVRAFPLTSWVCHRAPDGSPLRVILKEAVMYDDLPESVRGQITPPEGTAQDTPLDLYTGIRWSNGRAYVHQEVADIIVPGSDGNYPEELCPWNPVAMIRAEGESYGRSYVEEYIGDLKSLDSLRRTLVKGTAAAARTIWLVNPNGLLDDEDFRDADTGDVLIGEEQDVATVASNKSYDFREARAEAQAIMEGLAAAFLMKTSVQRDAERVTAHEIEMVVQELEEQLGGVYTTLSQSIQLPLVRVRRARLQRTGKLPALPKNVVKPIIITGVDAIGRGHDLRKLRQLTQFAVEAYGPEVAAKYLTPREGLNRAAAALGIDPEGYVKSEELLAQEQQQAQQAAMEQAAIAPAINQMGRIATAPEQQQPTIQ